MKIPEAIAILEGEVTYRDCFDNTDRYHALKLGIEALKRLQTHRTEHIDIGFNPLPGETVAKGGKNGNKS